MPVIPVAEARAELSAILRRFRSNPDSAPVVLGSHRKAEAVLIPAGQYHRLPATAIDLARLRALAPLIDRLATAAHVSDVRVFGSTARGEQTAGSDADLLVTPNAHATLFDIAQFEIDLEMLLGVPVSAVPATALDEGRDAAILRDAVAL